MHFCKFNLEFVGLGYRPYDGSATYNVLTFDLYRCKKCGKLIYKNEEGHDHFYKNIFDVCIENIEKCGYAPLGEIIKSIK